MVLRDQLFDVRQHQHAATRQTRQLGDDQAFACAGGQDNGRRFGWRRNQARVASTASCW
jgi:hypothetical protein